MMTSVDTDLIRVLADPLRLRIVNLLAQETLCTTHLVEETGARQTNLSNHLRVLREGRCRRDRAVRPLHVLQAPPGRHRLARRPVRGPGRVRPHRRREQEGLSVTRTEAPTTTAEESSVVAKLSTLDRFLAVWILIAMAVGLGLGRAVPGMNDALAHLEVGGISLPIALGLLIMMYPVLAKVRYDQLDTVTGDKRLMVSSLVVNWLIGPAVMFALAWIFLPDLPEYRTGLIIVGLARCIAMVIIWNDLACGDREAAAVLVALNSVFQVLAFGLLGWFYLDLLPQWLGLGDGQGLDVSVWKIALNVVVFLGVPLLAGFLTRRIGEKKMGRESYEQKFLPKIGPWALYGLLFTIVVLFALQGRTITSQPLDVVRIALPLLAYFAVMWAGTFLLGKAIGLAYDRTATLAFTAAGNNFELAIAVAIATFGVTSGQALSGVVGPLIEVPVLIGLVHVSLAWRRKFTPAAAR
ncbi:ACR3 family arsenite transporter [Streptomyces ambofaciens]